MCVSEEKFVSSHLRIINLNMADQQQYAFSLETGVLSDFLDILDTEEEILLCVVEDEEEGDDLTCKSQEDGGEVR